MRNKMKTNWKRLVSLSMVCVLTLTMMVGCGSSDDASEGGSASGSASASSGEYFNGDEGVETILKTAAAAGKVGNWGGGSEYEVQALLAKYGQDTTFLNQAFDMDGFDDDSIMLASAMTYNELGLVKNSYDGGYNYGDDIGIIDFNDENVGMLEDNLFCTQKFAKENPNTVKAVIAASMKGWQYACEHPDEAADIVYEYGSSVSTEHQKFMADEVKKLVETDMEGNTVASSELGKMDEKAMQQTLDITKKYITLDDSQANDALKKITLDDVRDTSYWEDAMANKIGKPEKTKISIQLKWLPQCQFMGYYVALKKGYFKDLGLDVSIVPGGGDIAETSAVYSGQVDFGTTWVATLISANASGMGLLEVAQVYQRSGMVLIYKKNK